jgi:hypothetical protein
MVDMSLCMRSLCCLSLSLQSVLDMVSMETFLDEVALKGLLDVAPFANNTKVRQCPLLCSAVSISV